MKVTHIISGDLWAGAEMQVFQTLNALKKNPSTHTECILFNSGILSKKIAGIGIPVYIMDEKKYNTISILKRCRSILKKKSPDLIHVHRNKEHLVGYFAKLFINKKIPIIRTIHGKSEKINNLSLIKQLRTKIVIKLDFFLVKYFCDCLVAVSNDMYQFLSRIYPTKKIVLIYNSISLINYENYTNSRETRNKYNIGDIFWIGTAARLSSPKNLEMLIRVASFLKGILKDSFKVSIFGDGPLRNELQALITKSNLDDTVFLNGFTEDVIPIISSFDVFVLTSFHEGLPMALLEAMALKKPVICTAVGGIKDVIVDKNNGYLVPSNDHIAMGKRILELFYNPDEKSHVGESAFLTIRDNFSIDVTINKLTEAYKLLTQRVLND